MKVLACKLVVSYDPVTKSTEEKMDKALETIAKKFGGFKEYGVWYFPSPYLKEQFVKAADKAGWICE